MRGRTASSKASPILDSDVPITPPAARPWAIRAPTRIAIVGATAHSTEAATKATMATR